MKIKTRSATEGPILSGIVNGFKEIGSKLTAGKQADKKLKEAFGITRKDLKDKNTFTDDAKLNKEAQKAKGDKWILATGEKDGKKINFTVQSNQKLSDKDVSNLMTSEAKKQGIQNPELKYVVSGEEGKAQSEKWPKWQAGGRINRGKGTEGQDQEIGKFNYDPQKAKEWNLRFSRMSDAKRYEFLKQHFPKSIKSSNAILQQALLKEKDPFTSDLYVFLYKYASTNNKDISDVSAKYLLSNWDVVARAFDKKMQGLDLSKNANQLAAMDYIEKNKLNIPYRNKNTTWLSYNEIKENIQNHSFTDEEKEAIKSGDKKTKRLGVADSNASNDAKRKALIALLGQNQQKFIESLSDDDLDGLYVQFEPTIKSGGPQVK